MPGFDFSQVHAGQSAKLYDYTVTAATKASIDTQVDDGGFGAVALPTIYDSLEIYLVCRTDEAVVKSVFNTNFNNDSGANYDYAFIDDTTSTVTGGGAAGVTTFQLLATGASAAASYPAVWKFEIPAYAGTTFFKSMTVSGGLVSGTNRTVDFYTVAYKSTSAITRVAFAPNTAAKNFVTGTRLIIFGRAA